MLQGQAKTDYMRDYQRQHTRAYMRDYMRKRRAVNRPIVNRPVRPVVVNRPSQVELQSTNPMMVGYVPLED